MTTLEELLTTSELSRLVNNPNQIDINKKIQDLTVLDLKNLFLVVKSELRLSNYISTFAYILDELVIRSAKYPAKIF